MKKGFTLIELMTAIAIFLVVMTVSMGSVIGVFESNRKSQALRAVMGNLNLAMESMSKEMRFGTNYHCGDEGNLEDPRDCQDEDTISFLSSESEQITYQYSDGAIEKSIDGGDFVAVTAPEIVIEIMSFSVGGSESGDEYQPAALILIKGYAGVAESRSDFVLQTVVSQRLLDI